MPELPEVARAARALTKAASGKTIASVRAIHPALKRKLPPARARRAKGRRIESIERRGKHQLLRLDSGDTLVVHFRMNGDWEIGTTADPLDRFARAVIELGDGTRISLVDRRALSSITLDKEGSSSLPKLGREASDKTLDAEYLSAALKKKDRHQACAHGSVGGRRPRQHLRSRSALGSGARSKNAGDQDLEEESREAGRRHPAGPESREAPAGSLHGDAWCQQVRRV